MMYSAILFFCFATSSVIATTSELAAPPGHESVVKMLERSYTIREEALALKQEGYEALNKAFDILVRAFSFIESQTSDDVREIKATLDRIVDRLDQVEAAVEETNESVKAAENKEIAVNMTEKFDSLDRKVDASITRLDSLDRKVDASITRLGQLESVVANMSTNLSARLGLIESGIETSSGKVEKTSEVIERVSEKVDALEVTVSNGTSHIEEKVDAAVKLSEESVQLGTSIKTRQQAWLSEVRLISLHKLTDENNPQSNRDYNPGLVVDGQFIFSNVHESHMRTYSHTRSSAADNKIWIKLGGLFRVYSVRVWNSRDGNKPKFSGTNIYVDDTLIGTASGSWGFYDFSLSEEKVVYGSKVTLHQPRSDYIILLEVQVWGNGPYNSTDIFN